MHPRNIYRDNPPDFTQLASEFPEFAALCSIDLNGKARLDFKNPEAVRILSKILLKKDFGLDVELPSDSLVPRIPLRLNYILWIEDLLSDALGLTTLAASEESTVIRGIDVGAGASCVYPLLGASLNGWHFVATEKNAAAAACARENVKRNHFEAQISVHEVSEQTALLPLVESFTDDFHFTMCNPPFYDSRGGESHQRPSRSQPHSTTIAKPDEIWAEGGEVAFVGRIIHDSQVLKTKVKIYSTMVGIKASLAPLKAKLKEAEMSDFVITTFSQGKTTRWALAWTFLPSVNLKSSKSIIPEKKVSFSMAFDSKKQNVSHTFSSFQQTLQELKLLVETDGCDECSCIATAYSNTWTNSRKRRRAALKANETETAAKRQKTDESAAEANGEKSSVEEVVSTGEVLLKTKISVSDSQVEFEWLAGSDKDCLNQLVQHFRNRFKS